ncbi:TetR/AcrR family transcriptional regulator [Pseudomaricurvus sp. HS19]|uniref:TetR/AcrR family transcriptional regulator n=1 Tax=Pseudomaricurvus sp. HS19 TaxID=2692626 RepID=UPI00136AFED0|nr:TetR/AcrR family transcriptional regulator [Pseudomaricurvus sp. HS19]MYM62837.1 TetR family transcriptional regulator [Pseudomaricurvus sp. HS19]
MARTPSVSDEEILKTGQEVLSERGASAFSITEVAKRVGLSRAAIILRYESTDALKELLVERGVQRFIQQLGTLPKEPGGDSLLAIAGFIGRHLGSRRGSSAFFSDHSDKIKNGELAKLEWKRGQALRQAILEVLPPTAISAESAAAAFAAHLTGSIFAWLSSEHPNAELYLGERTREWLTLAGIPCPGATPVTVSDTATES